MIGDGDAGYISGVANDVESHLRRDCRKFSDVLIIQSGKWSVSLTQGLTADRSRDLTNLM